ncbi:anthrone oxygenase family protein [Saccharibacillus alkalitolerans]|uniref:DUF1772 domain-containing protein n=1 Tax=Saccharibacillus alkalitolerans TaxID=2705290 RepID=A0ABX0FAF2_9BACL|nr:anthrone oxygenase family protein [Saccharibacillus alkalitolerans]NGZ76454.1 DUF1772 domain-containing protein [Saccharibacillus alkalitolerans]
MTTDAGFENVWFDALLLVCALGTGLMAGLFFVFSNSAMTAFVRMENNRGMAAMQGINASILNRPFLLLFFGTAVLSALCVAVFFGLERESRSPWMLTGALLYLTGGFGITAAFNVPLNRRLAALPADSSAGQAFWAHYAVVWTRWNHVRTICCTASLGCFVLAAAA